jgi:hypothetical protein
MKSLLLLILLVGVGVVYYKFLRKTKNPIEKLHNIMNKKSAELIVGNKAINK